MSERDQRQRLVGALRELDAISVENSAYAGTPDINYIGGWIECKWLRSWPKRRETIVKVSRFHQGQRVWAKRRIKKGGVVWFVLQVGKEWLLIDGAVAAEHIGKVTAYEIRMMAHRYWPNGLDDKEFLDAVRAYEKR